METILEEKNSAVVVPLFPKSRVDFIDIARGLLMILVVLGHSPFFYSKYIFWFHMPAFFIISGMLHRQPKEIGSFFSKRFFNLFIPYFAYGIVIGLIEYSFNTDKWVLSNFIYSQVMSTYTLLFWGGELLRGNFAVFWFINCFLLTIICFTLIKQWLKKDALIIFLAVFGFVGGYFLNNYLERPLPWVINVVPYAFTYFAIGYYTKDVLSKLKGSYSSLIILLVIIGSVLVYLGISGSLYFKIDMKYGEISNPVLGLFIPIVFTLIILLLSFFINNTSLNAILTYIGQNTLSIMYLHMVVNFLLFKIIGEALSHYLFLISGISIPLLIAQIFSRHEITKMIFLGYNSKGLFNSIAFKHRIRAKRN